MANGDRPGQVAMWPNAPGFASTTLMYFDPANPQAATVTLSNLATNIFCSGHTFARNGSLIIMGGEGGVGPPPTSTPLPAPNQGYILDPYQLIAPPTLTAASPFITPPLQGVRYRYYPTAMTLNRSSGASTLVIGGTTYTYAGPAPPGSTGNCTYPPTDYQCNLKDIEILTPGATSTYVVHDADPADHILWDWYPVLFQLSSGSVFVLGDTHIPGQAEFSGSPEGASYFITFPSIPPTSVSVTGPIFGGEDRFYGSAVLIHQLVPTSWSDRVLYFGGSAGCNPAWGPPTQMPCNGDLVVHSSVREFRPTSSTTGAWHPKTPLLCQRVFMNAVVLPTKTVFCVGGSTSDPHNDPFVGFTPIYHGELFDPGPDHLSAGSTTYTAPSNPVPGSSPAKYTPRTYHQVALLLPDASVLVAGGTQLCPQSTFGFSEASGEVYYPPYFFQGARPSIVSSPTTAHFSANITVSVNVPNWPNDTIDRFVLMRPGSITHFFDTDQRYIELSSTDVGGTHGLRNYSVTLPSPNHGPPGHYMLFAILANGGNRIPSRATFISLP